MKKYNFNAGPSILPKEVMEATAAACLEFEGSGLSLMETSHRAKNFQPVVDEAVALFKELLDIPEGYKLNYILAIGYPDEQPEAKPRDASKVKYIK